MARAGLKRVVKTVKGKRGPSRRAYWVRAAQAPAKGQKGKGFLRKHWKGVALAAGALALAAGTAYGAHRMVEADTNRHKSHLERQLVVMHQQNRANNRVVDQAAARVHSLAGTFVQGADMQRLQQGNLPADRDARIRQLGQIQSNHSLRMSNLFRQMDEVDRRTGHAPDAVLAGPSSRAQLIHRGREVEGLTYRPAQSSRHGAGVFSNTPSGQKALSRHRTSGLQVNTIVRAHGRNHTAPISLDDLHGTGILTRMMLG